MQIDMVFVVFHFVFYRWSSCVSLKTRNRKVSAQTLWQKRIGMRDMKPVFFFFFLNRTRAWFFYTQFPFIAHIDRLTIINGCATYTRSSNNLHVDEHYKKKNLSIGYTLLLCFVSISSFSMFFFPFVCLFGIVTELDSDLNGKWWTVLANATEVQVFMFLSN